MTEINELLSGLRSFQENQDYTVIDRGREKIYLIRSKELAKTLRRILSPFPYFPVERNEINRVEASRDGSCYVYQGDASALSDRLTIRQSSTRITDEKEETEASSSSHFVSKRFSNEGENIFQSRPIGVGGLSAIEKAFQEDWGKLQRKSAENRNRQGYFQSETSSARIVGELKNKEEERRWLAGEDSDTEMQEAKEVEEFSSQ